MVGDYSLAAGAVAPERVPDRVKKGLARYPVPVILLAQLAASYTNPVRLSDLPGHNPQPDFSFERPRIGQSYRVCVSAAKALRR